MDCRSLLVALGMLLSGALAGPAAAAADDFPSRPIRAIIPAAAGSGTDALVRAFAAEAVKRLRQPLVSENVAGGGGIIATRTLMSAPADGYTVLTHGPAMVTNMLTDPAAGYRMDDFIAVSSIGQISFTLGVSPAIAAKNIPELVAHLKANPGKLNYGSIGSTSLNGLSTERMLAMTGTKVQAIDYKSAPAALLDLMSDRIQLYLQTTPLLAPQAQAGKIRALAVTSEARSFLLPEVPTFRELGMPDMFVTVWIIAFVPKATPAPVVAALRQAFSETAVSPDFVAKQRSGGFEPLVKTGKELDDYIRQEVQRWEIDIKRTRAAGAQP
jgi:tripartite-type tricarboxylate transporter receptor subunit TctC